MIVTYSPFLGYYSSHRPAKEVAHVCAALAAGQIGDLTYHACIANDNPIAALDERHRRLQLGVDPAESLDAVLARHRAEDAGR